MNPRLLKLTVLAAVLAPQLLMAAPALIAQESFEGAGGAIGFNTSVPQFDEGTITATGDFFSVQPNNGTKVIGGIITGGDGPNMFAAEDIDTVPGPGAGPTQSITFNPVNISGKTLTSVKILIAAPGNGPGGANSQLFYDWSATASEIDFILVEASVDGAPFVPLAQFSPHTGTTSQPLSRDTDFNGIGGGTLLNAIFQEFDFPFPTGNSVQIRVTMHSNQSNEYICIDNVRIFGDTAVTASPVLGGVSGTALLFTEGGAAAALAPAITVTDSDSANLAFATVTITANLTSGEDVLAATPSGAILAGDIVYTPGTGTLTITRNAPLATYQTVLRSVTYQNSNVTAPSTATRNITFGVNDGVNAGNSPIRQVDVVDNILTHNLPFTESFETDGRGTRYALDGRFTPIGAAMFDRGAPAGTANLDGTFAVIAEDTLLDAAPVKAARFHLNTAGFATVNASVRLGALGGAIYDTGDIIAIEASVNGGPYNIVAAFRSTGAGSTPMALDTDLNGTGDGTQLTATMQDFSFPMPAATTLGLRVRSQSNVAGERLIVDRIVVTGTTAPEIAVSGNSVDITDGDAIPSLTDHTDFGSTPVAGGTVVRTFTIANSGTADLTLGAFTIGGAQAAEFTVTSPPGSPVTPGNSTTFQVTFNPSASGLRSATVSFVNNDSNENPFNFSIQGTGTVAPEIAVSGNSVDIADGDAIPSLTDHTDFGSTPVTGGTVVRTFTIANSGNADLTLGAFTIGGAQAAEFTVTSPPGSPVTPGNSTAFQVTFNPSAGGVRSATVSFVNNDSDENPFNFSIQGTGTVAPEIAVSGNSVDITDGDAIPSLTDHTDFGSTPVTGGTVVRTFTIANSGNADLTLGAFTIGGAQAAEFTVTTPPGSPVTPGNSTTFQVTFDPSASGLRSATVSFVNNDNDENPFDFSIQGTGTSPVNQPPVAPNQTFVRAPGLTLKIKIADVLAACSDPDGGTPALDSVGVSAQGATISQTATHILYTLAADANDSFPYTISDGQGGTTTGTITVLVVNPGGLAQTITSSGGSVTINFAGIPGFTYDIQRSATAADPWTTRDTQTAPPNGLFSYSETPPGSPYFYRLLQHIAP